MKYVMVKSYDNKIVKIPEDKKEEYLNMQEKIKYLLKQGKTLEEIKELIKNENQRRNNLV